MSQTRRLAAILAADVAGYSRLIGADEGGTLERLKALRRDLLDPKIAEHRGRLVKTTGDGLLVEFGSVVDALRCRRYAAVAAALSHAYMQEGITGAIRELHEAEPLLGIVPLDGGADGWTGRCFELRPARRSKSEPRRFVVVVVETPAAVRTKIPVSVVHGRFLSELWEVPITW